MSLTLHVPVSAGEVIDKITILEIKAARLADPDQRGNAATELAALTDAAAAIPASEALQALRRDLRAVNETLWQIEDDIRGCERDGDFGPRFVDLARSVYRTNDRRAALKRAINLLTGSVLIEEKSYKAY